jgi:hypothetical protein
VTYVLLYHDVVRMEERDAVGFPGPAAGRYKLTPEAFAAHLDAIEEMGVDIGPRREVLDEWRRSRDALAALIGREPVAASVPGGSLSSTVVECASEAGYRVLMTSEPTARAHRHDERLVVVGRFGIWATTPAERAAAFVVGARRPRARLWLEWNGKKLAKRLNAPVYERLRELRARRS